MKQTDTILITGASSGIGAACAERFAQAGVNLVLLARRLDKIKKMASDLSEKHGVQILVYQADVTIKSDVQAVYDDLLEKKIRVTILLNNAGLALGLDYFHEANTDDWDVMIDTNLKGLLYVSRIFSADMVDSGEGHIINMGSISGLDTYEKGNAYCASKYAVHALTKAMRIDLLGKHIRVTEINPGACITEFSEVRFKGDKVRADEFYQTMPALTAADVADAVVYAASCPAHVNIEQIVLMHRDQASVHHSLSQA